MEEAVKLIEHEHQARADGVRLYHLGQIPVHQLVDQCGLNIAALHIKDRNAAFAPTEHSPVFVRHGRRGAEQVRVLSASTRVNLDVTTILLVHRFNLWEAFQRTFAELRCSHIAIPMLQRCLKETSSREPAVAEAQRGVWQLLRDGRIQTDDEDRKSVV